MPNGDVENSESGPTYSAADLQELKESTPITPSMSEQESSSDSLTLQLHDKFGSSLSKYGQSSAIPSAAEIAEKKERRARLAMEQKADEYISLDPDNPGWEEDEDGNVMRDLDGRLVLKERDRYNIQESRLARDDEDVMEGFDEFTGEAGSRIIMGASAKAVDQQTRRDEITRQMAQADIGSDDDDFDNDERTQNAAFEAAQTRHGKLHTGQAASYDKYAAYRAKTPPIITPIPTLDDVIKRFKASVLDLESRKREKQAELLHLSREKSNLKQEEERVQRQLKEVAEKYRQIRIEKGLLPRDDQKTPTTTTVLLDSNPPVSAMNGTNSTLPADDDDEKEEELDEEDHVVHTGLGAVPPSSASVATNEDDLDEADQPRVGIGLGSAGAAAGWTM